MLWESSPSKFLFIALLSISVPLASCGADNGEEGGTDTSDIAQDDAGSVADTSGGGADVLLDTTPSDASEPQADVQDVTPTEPDIDQSDVEETQTEDADLGDVDITVEDADAAEDSLDDATLVPDADIVEEVSDDVDILDDSEDSADSEEEAGIDSETIEEDIDPGPQPCEPALQLDPASSWVLPFGLVQLTASGGTGAYQFALIDADSEALLNELTGAYLAGGAWGAEDSIVLTDAGCIGEASAQITTVTPLAVLPSAPIVSPGASITFVTEGGSPSIAFELLLSPSGGSVTVDGTYTAGAEVGQDVLVVTDLETEQSLQVVIDVQDAAVLHPRPPRLFLPVGATFDVAVDGGSGVYSLSLPDSGIATLDTETSTTLRAEAAGVITIDATDDFLGLSTTIEVTVVEPLYADLPRTGDNSNHAQAIAPGDLNGDGFEDIVFGWGEADIDQANSGAVFIYAGVEGGFEPTPAQVLTYGGIRAFFGRGVAMGDLNADGQLDLVVGAQAADVGATDNGAVFVYFGIEGDFYPTYPDLILPGAFGSDNHGINVVVCDFNGDGHLDIAGGSPSAEDRDLDPLVSAQGAIHLYLGDGVTFDQEPTQSLYGVIPDGEGGWLASATLKLGETLAAGDMDGDGLCDLASGHMNYESGPNRSDDGSVHVFRGQGPTDDTPGGLSPRPLMLMVSDGADNTGNFGRRLSMGDVTGDGKDELFVSHYNQDDASKSGSNHGALRVYLGQEFPAEPPLEHTSADQADMTYWGKNSGDRFAWTSHVADIDGEEPLDLIISAMYGEVPDGPNTTGHFQVHLGRLPETDEPTVEDILPSPEPALQYGGEVGNDIFGQRVAVLGDIDGDGLRDYFVVSGRHDEYGYEVGLPCVQFSDPELPWLRLELPGESAANQFGRAVAVVDDMSGDGRPEVSAGMPDMDVEGEGLYTGQAVVYMSTEEGHEALPSVILSGHNRHSGYDRVGNGVEGTGDFDGDGFNDLLLVARSEDSPSSYPSLFSDPEGCAGGGSNMGFVSVYRGKADGTLEVEPSFFYQGPQAGRGIRSVKGGLDINGDGLMDFIAGDRDWGRPGASQAGGFAVVLGRPHLASQDDDETTVTDVLCTPAFTYVGLKTNDFLAGEDAITTLGDLNSDGCDDFAVGAYGEDFANSTQGSVRVFFGWGGEGCPAEPSMLTLVPFLNGAQSGYGLAGGEDLNGDGVNDLVVGGHRLTVNGNSTGAAWLISGAYLLTLEPEAVVDNAMPQVLHPMIPSDQGLEGVWRVDGQDDDEWFGAAVALVKGLLPGGQVAVAIGAPFSGVSGVARTGAVKFFEVYPGNAGFNLNPVAIFGGETWAEEGLIGRALDAGHGAGVGVLAIGGYEGNTNGLDNGSVYALTFSD